MDGLTEASSARSLSPLLSDPGTGSTPAPGGLSGSAEPAFPTPPPLSDPSTPPESASGLPAAAAQLANALALGERLPDAVLRLALPIDEAVKWLQTPEFAHLLREKAPTDDLVRATFLAEAGRSVQTIADIRDGAHDPKVRLAAARDLLDRAGHTPIRKVATVSFVLPRERQQQVKEVVAELVEEEE